MHNFKPEAALTLWLRNDSIFPSCVNELTISWRLPSNCNISMLNQVLDFRIRVFASTLDSKLSVTNANFYNSPKSLYDANIVSNFTLCNYFYYKFR